MNCSTALRILDENGIYNFNKTCTDVCIQLAVDGCSTYLDHIFLPLTRKRKLGKSASTSRSEHIKGNYKTQFSMAKDKDVFLENSILDLNIENYNQTIMDKTGGVVQDC